MGRAIRILAAADLHNQKEQLSVLEGIEADIVVFCGDLHNGTASGAEEVAGALSSLGPPVLIVPGNMDPRDRVPDIWERAGLHMIHNSSFFIQNAGFIGYGGMVVRNPSRIGDPTRYYHLDDEVYESLARLHKEVEAMGRRAVVVHQPPRGARDTLYNGEQSGSQRLRQFVLEHQPDLLLCGHIHEDRGEAWIGGTKVVNVGELRMGYAAIVEVGATIEVSWVQP